MRPHICTALIASVLIASFIMQPTDTQTSQTSNDTFPVKHPAKILNGCPSTEEREMTLAEIDQEINALIRNTVLPILNSCPGNNQQNPAASCLEIAECDPSLPSGYYWINTTTQVYCDMEREASCSNGTGGWTRVAYLNMTDPTHQCPSPWGEITFPVRTCRRSIGYRSEAGCESVIFSTNGIEYSNVLGRIGGYQYGGPKGFSQRTPQTIDGYYLDGVSITHGMPRDHIWSFTATYSDNIHCPCESSILTPSPTAPSFVGEDYFCESGNAVRYSASAIFYEDDPLWDGKGCGRSTCCTYNNPPWFCKQLPQATTDDIEIRICAGQGYQNNDTPIELIEMYIQ